MARAEAVAEAPVSEASKATSRGSIHYENDRLTMRVKDVPVGDVLEEIARQSDLTLVLHEPMQAAISIEFYRLSLEDALRRILGEQGFALEYAQPSSREVQQPVSKPEMLWVFAKGQESRGTDALVGEPTVRSSPHLEADLGDPTANAMLTSSDPWEREEAVEALGKQGQPEAVEVLGLALEDASEEVREAAIHALVRIGGDHAAQTVAVALRDRDDSIRKEAVEALGKIGGVDAVQALGHVLRGEDRWLREEAVEALGDVGGESAVALLQQALHDQDRHVREIAAETLARIRK